MTVICRSHDTSGDAHTGINNAFLTVSHDDRGDVHPSHGGHLQEVIHCIGGEVELHHRELEGWGVMRVFMISMPTRWLLREREKRDPLLSETYSFPLELATSAAGQQEQ